MLPCLAAETSDISIYAHTHTERERERVREREYRAVLSLSSRVGWSYNCTDPLCRLP